MLKIITFIIIVALISLGLNWVLTNDGQVEFIWLGYQINTKISFIIFVIVALFLFFILFLELIKSIISVPINAKKAYKKQKLNHDLKLIKTGYSALLAGDVETAKKLSVKLLTSPSENKNVRDISDILAAKIAHEQGSYITADKYYNKFLEKNKKDYFSIKGKLDNAFQQGKVDEAIDLAEKAYRLKPNVKDGAHSVLEIYKKSEKIDKAEKFLRKYRSRHRIFKDKNNKIDIKKELAELKFLRSKALFQLKSDKKNIIKALSHAKDAFENFNDKAKLTLHIMAICRELKDEKTAKNYIEKLWKISPNFECANAYLDVFTAPSSQELERKKNNAITALQNIHLDPEMEEKLRDSANGISLVL